MQTSKQSGKAGAASAAAPRPRRSGPGLLVSLLALAVFLALVALGTWQVQRLAWKEGLIASIETRMQADPVPLDEIAALKQSGEPIEYRPTRASGHFLHEGEQYFFATHGGASGFYVYTPLVRDDASVVFVNRGFVPYDLKDPARRPEGQVEGQVEVTGLARDRLEGKPSWVVPENDLVENVFYWKDIDAMAENAGIDPARLVDFFVDADATPNPGGLPAGGVTIVNLPNSHLQYAVTWYGLAATLLVVFALRFFRRGGDGRSRPDERADPGAKP